VIGPAGRAWTLPGGGAAGVTLVFTLAVPGLLPLICGSGAINPSSKS
jgi:hypothetical protein